MAGGGRSVSRDNVVTLRPEDEPRDSRSPLVCDLALILAQAEIRACADEAGLADAA